MLHVDIHALTKKRNLFIEAVQSGMHTHGIRGTICVIQIPSRSVNSI